MTPRSLTPVVVVVPSKQTRKSSVRFVVVSLRRTPSLDSSTEYRSTGVTSGPGHNNK